MSCARYLRCSARQRALSSSSFSCITRIGTLASGVVHSFLAGLAALALLGIFYPLRMLPLLLHELLWKSIWLLGIALPLWLSNQFDADTRQTFYECIGVVILIPIIPWRYLFRGPDPWHRTSAAPAPTC